MFKKNAERNLKFEESGKPKGHWKIESLDRRWKYHSRAIDIISQSGTDNPKKILELGTMGASLVIGSDTMDYEEKWNYEGKKATFVHDARQIPWPVEDKHYEWFVALRVFHHLWPIQQRCFEEAKRIAHNVIIVVPLEIPPWDKKQTPRTDAGITPRQFLKWNNGRPPKICEFLESYGILYWWDDSATCPFQKKHNQFDTNLFLLNTIPRVLTWKIVRKLKWLSVSLKG